MNKILFTIIASLFPIFIFAQSHIYDSRVEVLLYTTLEQNAEKAISDVDQLKSSSHYEDSYSSDLFNSVGRTLVNLGRIQEAKKIIHFGLQEFPDDIKLFEAYAQAELKVANYISADSYFKRALSVAENDTTLDKSYIKSLKDQYTLVNKRQIYTKISGVYILNDKDSSMLLVKYDPYQGTYPGFVHLKTGQYEVLYPETDTTFYYRNNSGHQDGKILFNFDSKSTELTWVKEDSSMITGSALPLKFRDIDFNSTGAQLKGTLISPNNEEPYPAVVLVHGAGYLTRYNLFYEALNFAAYGIAAFVYDKRGTGLSTGSSPLETPYKYLSEDASSAVDAVVIQPEIANKSVGLWGHSEGGWIVPMTSNNNPKVAFDIIAAGSSADVFDQGIQSVKATLKDKDFSRTAIDQAVNYMTNLKQEIKEDSGYSDIKPIIKQAELQKWGEYVIKPGSNWELDLWRMLMEHEAKNQLTSVNVPLLAIYGENDNTVPPSLNTDTLIDYLKSAPTTSYSVEIIEKANHQFLVGGEEYSTDYFSIPVRWIKSKPEFN